ncbi:MAG: hypothetical protein ABR956_13815, partial [Terracidiphilus sp.]
MPPQTWNTGGQAPARLPVGLIITRFRLPVQGFSGNYRKFIGIPAQVPKPELNKSVPKPSRLGLNNAYPQEVGLLRQMVR